MILLLKRSLFRKLFKNPLFICDTKLTSKYSRKYLEQKIVQRKFLKKLLQIAVMKFFQ